jgi:hypothetical protein
MTVDWLNINPLRGGTGQTDVYAYVTENTKVGSTRKALVRFTNDEGLTADLNLVQPSNTSEMNFMLTPGYIYVQPGGGTYYVNIATNTFWKVTDYDPTLTITTDNVEGFEDGVLIITFPPNPNTDNWYGYDHMGRPFYGRDGEITVKSPAGEATILWEQPAFNAITVTPNSLLFPQTGGTLSVTVKSDSDWTILSYDTDNVRFSALSGHSGETVIQVTKAALTNTQMEYYVTKPSEAIFSDGNNTAVLSLDTELGIWNDDDWITVTYNVPSANTEVILYGYENTLAIQPTVVFEDDNHTEIRKTSFDTVSYTVGQYYTTFTTPGEHIVKYKFNKPGTIIPRYGFPAGNIAGVGGIACYEKIVIGNLCEGAIEACAAKDTGFKQVVLGLGNITGIGEAAFMGCGSYDYDFVFGSNVAGYTNQPFHNFKAKKFIFDRPVFGTTAEPTTHTYTSSGIRKVIISGSTAGSWSSNQWVTGQTINGGWTDGYPGDIDCAQLVFGEKVETIGGTPFYPFGLKMSKTSNELNFNYAYATTTFYGTDKAKINGWRVGSMAFITENSPTVVNYDLTPVTQIFKNAASTVHIPSTFATYTKGPSRNITIHYPIGADYSAWGEGGWTSLIGDIDI